MKRLDFIKSLGLIAGGTIVAPKAKSEKLTINSQTSNADMNIGVERLRISSSGSLSMSMPSPYTKLDIGGLIETKYCL